MKQTQGKGAKISTLKRRLQIFSIALTRTKAGNGSENLLHKT